MSHVNVVKVKITDTVALEAAAKALNFEQLGNSNHTLYNGQKADGFAFKLPGWSYPVVINPETGEAKYDNYEGHWGKQVELDRLVQRYGVEAARLESQRMGYGFEETTLSNGDVEVTLTDLVTV